MFNHPGEVMAITTPAMTEEEIEIKHEIRHEVIEYDIQHEEETIQMNSAESIESLPNPGSFLQLASRLFIFK